MDMTIGAAYKCQIGAEPLQKYCPGGYHPTHIGDKYADGRYEIVHKLGSGTYSTVWLAKDHIANKLVALKILVANSITKTAEAETLRELAAGNDAHEGKRSVVALLDEFIVDGPNGRHRCLVLEVAGCSLYRSRRASPSTQFPLGVARAIAMELILGVDYIHSCGRVHGDFHPDNVMIFDPVFDKNNTDIDELYRVIGKPQKLPVERHDGSVNEPDTPMYCLNLPIYCVPRANMCKPSESLTDPRIVITDFGRSFKVGEELRYLRAPLRYLSPEAIFDEQLTQAADIWGLGCTFFEVLSHRALFGSDLHDEIELVASMISTLGDLPDHWWNMWWERKYFFNDDRSWKLDTALSDLQGFQPLGDRLLRLRRGMNLEYVSVEAEERQALEELLTGMLNYSPADRMTAREVVRSCWMREWTRADPLSQAEAEQ